MTKITLNQMKAVSLIVRLNTRLMKEAHGYGDWDTQKASEFIAKYGSKHRWGEIQQKIREREGANRPQVER